MSDVREFSDEAIVSSVVQALEHFSPDAEILAKRLVGLPESVLDKHLDRLGEALVVADQPTAMRVLNLLPASFTRRHAETFIARLNRTGGYRYAAGAFVVFRARSVHRSNLTEWGLDKALWKWMRHTDVANLELVLQELGPDWGSLWADYVSTVFGSGRLSRRIRKLAAALY